MARCIDAATTRWLLRFGYDGAAFYGWARQPGLRTIEDEILHGLVHHGIVPSPSFARLEVASRTDRGVSARRNALALTASLPGPALLRALNGLSPEIVFTAATEVADGFRVRRALHRVYRYFESSAPTSWTRWREAAALFSGRIDVRSFGRGLPVESPQWRTVESVRITAHRAGAVIDVRAPSFVWGMVRKIVGALREVDHSRLELDQLSRALAGIDRLTLPLAEPEPLVLWDVQLPVRWEYRWVGPNRHQARSWEHALAGSRTRQRVLRAITAPWTPPGRSSVSRPAPTARASGPR